WAVSSSGTRSSQLPTSSLIVSAARRTQISAFCQLLNRDVAHHRVEDEPQSLPEWGGTEADDRHLVLPAPLDQLEVDLENDVALVNDDQLRRVFFQQQLDARTQSLVADDLQRLGIIGVDVVTLHHTEIMLGAQPA